MGMSDWRLAGFKRKYTNSFGTYEFKKVSKSKKIYMTFEDKLTGRKHTLPGSETCADKPADYDKITNNAITKNNNLARTEQAHKENLERARLSKEASDKHDADLADAKDREELRNAIREAAIAKRHEHLSDFKSKNDKDNDERERDYHERMKENPGSSEKFIRSNPKHISMSDLAYNWKNHPFNIPDHIQERIKKRYGEDAGLPDEHFNEIMRESEKIDNAKKVEDAVEDNQQKRNNDFATLDNTFKPPASDPAETREMAQQAPYKQISDNVHPGESVNPQDLHRMGQQNIMSRHQGRMSDLSENLALSAPDAPIKFKPGPTEQDAYDRWNSAYKNPPSGSQYVYGRDREFNNMGHQLANSGHGKGSSSFNYVEDERQKSHGIEDVQGVSLVHQLMMAEHAGNSADIAKYNSILNGYGSANENATASLNSNMGQMFNMQNQKMGQDKTHTRGVVQDRQSMASGNIGEHSILHNLRETIRFESKKDAADYQTAMSNLSQLAKTNQIDKFLTDQSYSNDRDNLWKYRDEFLAALRSEGREDEALRMQKKKDKRDFYMGIAQLALSGTATGIKVDKQMIARKAATGGVGGA